MSLEQEPDLALEAAIVRDAASWSVDLDTPAHEYSLWTPFPGRMAHCGSKPTLDAAYEHAGAHIHLKNVYVVKGPKGSSVSLSKVRARLSSSTMPTAEDFRRALFETMQAALHEGREFLDITAGELHRRVGGYPGQDHRMPLCCHVMKTQVSEEWGDRVIDEPLSGQGPTLRIRYRIPRGENA